MKWTGPAVAAVVFCTWSLLNAAPATLSPNHTNAYERAKEEFDRALFLKPTEPTNKDLSFDLAPLILQEVTGINHLKLDLPNTLRAGALTAEPSRPVVFVQADSVQLNGREHARFSYFWVYPSTGVQGIRLTLNAEGQPVIWEVLAESAGQELIFVSDNLEAAAKREFGPPLSGRRYSIEGKLTDAPKLVVPRLIADNGVPMGPMVYQRARTHEVTTVLCRCMPPQVKEVIRNCNYALIPLNSGSRASLLASAQQPGQVPTTYWPEPEGARPRVAKCLRLPKEF